MLEKHIRQLVESEDPVEEVWKMLVELWNPDIEIGEYFRQEDSVNEFERELKNTFFEIYDLLYKEIMNTSFRLKLPLVIVDGLSLREGNLLQRDLKTNGFEIVEYSYGFSALPSDTKSYRNLINTKYMEIKSGKTPSEMNFKSPVWISYPDEILHHAAKMIPPAQAYGRTKDVLLEVLERIENDIVTIISDHGYIIVNSVWALPKRDRKFLKQRVFGSSRYVRRDGVDEEVLKRLNKLPIDMSYIFIDDNHCYVRGRYFWPIGGYGKVVAHGGLSLMECIVPRILVKV